MERTKVINLLIGPAAGLGAAIFIAGCNPGDHANGGSSSEGPSTGSPAELADQVAPITERPEADAFPEAGIRVK